MPHAGRPPESLDDVETTATSTAERPTLTAAARQRLRQLVDQARRQQLAAADKTPARQRCSGCGRPHYTYTPGCPQCADRKASRARRQA